MTKAKSEEQSILRIARKLPPKLGGQEFHVADLSRYQAQQPDGTVFVDFAVGNAVSEPDVFCRRVMPQMLVNSLSSDVVQACVFSVGVALSNLVRPRQQIDVVHVHGDIIEIAAAKVVAWRYRALLVATLHAGLSHRKWYKMLASRVLGFPAAIICVSGDIADQVQYITSGRQHVYKIHSGINRALFAGSQRETQHVPAKVVSVGRLHSMKGYKYLLAAAASPTLRDRISVEIVGAGPEEEELVTLAEQLGAPVRFLGRRTKEEIADILAAADVFVSASVQLAEQSEGTPTVIMEAMAAGLPVVATDIGGAKAIVVQNKNGLIVAHSDVKALAAAIDQVLSDSLSFQQFSKRNLSDSAAFDWTAIGSKVAAVYKQTGWHNALNKDG